MYHPRIAVQNDFIFGRLDWKEKDAFNRLYNHYYYQRHNQFWYQEAMKKLPILTQATSMLVCGEDFRNGSRLCALGNGPVANTQPGNPTYAQESQTRVRSRVGISVPLGLYYFHS